MSYTTSTMPIEQGKIYHIYTHAVGYEMPFLKDFQCRRLLADIGKRMPAVSEIYAYCIMGNHLHLMLKVTAEPPKFSKALGDVQNAYAKWYNTLNHRMGSIFVKPFKRRIVNGSDDLIWLPWYIHRNPLHHRITTDWQGFPWSSFRFYLDPQSAPPFLNTTFLVNKYGNLQQMLAHHLAASTSWVENELV
jgi:REP element-mobilizing transposase RayT